MFAVVCACMRLNCLFDSCEILSVEAWHFGFAAWSVCIHVVMQLEGEYQTQPRDSHRHVYLYALESTRHLQCAGSVPFFGNAL